MAHLLVFHGFFIGRAFFVLTDPVKKELVRIVGKRNVTFERADLLCYSYDATNRMSLPEAVVFPADADEISLILKMANAERFPVVPRGAGSGFTGGSVPVEGGVALSTERMTRIIDIDTSNLTAVVEPGVVTWDLQQEVEKLGLFYPPDPTSQRFSTIGGNIAENAGGPRAVKYGVTRDYVLGLELVLPTGEVITTGVRTAKGVVGYDLTRLIVGSEGTLGVVTRATLRLIPRPAEVRTMLALFPTVEAAAAAVAGVIASKIVPSTLEFMDGVSIRCVEEYAKVGLPDVEALLLIELDGGPGAAEAQAAAVEKVCMDQGAESVRVAAGKGEVKDLWKARRALSASMFRVRPDKINEDVVVPRSEMPRLVAGVREIAARRGVVIACFGHAGDGNIHVNVMYDGKDPVEAASAAEAVTDVFDLTLKLGGTISGEHGVGTSKAPYLGMEIPGPSVELMKRIKKAFDPAGVINPGKIFLKETPAPAVAPD